MTDKHEVTNQGIVMTNSIDKVTVTNLDIALRMCGIRVDKPTIDKIIDLVELIEEKGDNVTIKDITDLKELWK